MNEAKPADSMAPWSRDRLDALRAALKADDLAGFILPLADEHLGEFMPDSSRRLSWLTGFTGSSGTTIVLAEKAALFVDGRYALQASSEVDTEAIEVRHFRKPPPLEWLTQQLSAGARIGYDPRITSVRTADQLNDALKEVGATTIALNVNPVDPLWTERPPPPRAAVELYPLEFAGVSADDKITAIASELGAKRVAATVLDQLDAIAWLFNIRGHDAPHTPVAQSFAILNAVGRAELFIDPAKVAPELAARLGNRVAVRDIGELAAALAALGTGGATIAIDPDRTNSWIRDRLVAGGARIRSMTDPTVFPRARKNSVEVAGMRSAHQRDGLAVTLFLKWVTQTVLGRSITELDAVAELNKLRARDPRFRGESFDTIAGAGPDGAIVHYHPLPQTNRTIEQGTLLLIDSGAQYLDGTTDVTRTVAIGVPTAEMRRHFTLVLKAHIAVALARFPKGATGGQVDVLARQHVWGAGLDYDHGTGHGVGVYLGVHEGPQRLAVGDTTKLEPGMIISNEPGLYFAGQYGIRTENLVLVNECKDFTDFLEFETLTLAPIDRSLIERALLDRREIEWLDAYHARQYVLFEPQMSTEDAAWLRQATQPI